MEDVSSTHELTLVGEILALLKQFNGARGIALRPDALCDTLLIVAGLLHKEAAYLKNPDTEYKTLEDSFVDRAYECILTLKLVAAPVGLLQ